MHAVFVPPNRTALAARRDRALASVQLTADELHDRVTQGKALPDEREAWEEVDAVNFLLDSLAEEGCGSDMADRY